MKCVNARLEHPARLLLVAVCCLLTLPMAACAQPDAKNATIIEDVPVLSPKAVISLAYPNPWDFNKLIALSNDGRYLIDASETARNIRVWDWEKKEVVQRLLLNEDTPDRNDGKPHIGGLKFLGGGQNLVLTPDGRMVAACVGMHATQPPSYKTAAKARVWSLASGEVVANLYSVVSNLPGYAPEAVTTSGCDAISFSPDGKYMAVASDGGAIWANEEDFLVNFRTSKPIRISSIALYETKNWQLLRLIPVLESDSAWEGKRQKLNSRILFTGDSKQVLGAVFDIPPLTPRGKYEGEWVGSRVVRWDVATGAVLEEKISPNIGKPDVGVWWHWLPGGHEVWWSTYTETRAYQTRDEARQCEAASADPAFVSAVVENCAYNWAIAILDIETGKIKYLVPFKKNPPQPVLIDRELRSFFAGISPDGTHLVSFNDTSKTNTFPPVNPESIIDVINRETLLHEGRYSWNGASGNLIFSGDSKFFAVKAFKRGQSAMLFAMPGKK